MNAVLLIKDFGSDPLIGLIGLIGGIIVMAVWIAVDSDSASNFMAGDLKHGEKGNHTERNRRRRHKRREREINQIRQITTPNIDGQYLYIFKWNDLYKIGISNNPEYRRKQVQKQLSNGGVVILFVGSVRYGRTVDSETLCHRDLSSYNQPVYYNNGTVSPEWFNCTLSDALSVTNQYADMNAY